MTAAVAAGRAVVLGGGMCGLLVARVLADRFDRVLVVDRDEFPAPGTPRRGVPQDRHVHALQTLGKVVIERLFPGVSEELVEQGARSGDWGSDATFCYGGHRLQRAHAGLDLLAASRPLLEGHVRSRLRQVPNVDLVQARNVLGLVAEADRIVGVRVQDRREAAPGEVLEADLVVDATGRASRLPRWLEELGFEAPEVEETGLEVTYTSCLVPRYATDERHAIIVGAVAPHGRRGGGAVAVEGDSYVLTLTGVAGERAPTDPAGFVEFASTLVVPDLFELVRDRELQSEPVMMRFPTSRRRRYDALDRFPDRLVVVGDALCSFNPAYGQGMSVAAAEAVALGECLDTGLDRIARRFHRATARLVGDTWAMAAASDAAFLPRGAAGPALRHRLRRGYRARVLEAAARDPAVSRAFRSVMALTEPPSSLRRPGIAIRVLAARHRTN